MPKKLTGWRFGVLVGGLVTAIGVAIYPIAVKPMMDTSEYSKATFNMNIIFNVFDIIIFLFFRKNSGDEQKRN